MLVPSLVSQNEPTKSRDEQRHKASNVGICGNNQHRSRSRVVEWTFNIDGKEDVLVMDGRKEMMKHYAIPIYDPKFVHVSSLLTLPIKSVVANVR